MASLTVKHNGGAEPERVVELSPLAECTVGRSPNNTVVLNDNRVSRAHLALCAAEGSFRAEDLGSKFGTILNDAPLAAATLLKPGDRLSLGNYTLVFDAAAAGRSAPPVAPPPKAEECVIAQDPILATMAVLYTDEMMAMKKRIHEKVLLKLNLPEIATTQLQDGELVDRLESALDQVLREVRHELPCELNGALFRQALLDELIGYGPITPMLRDDSVDEVMVNGPDRIFVERSGQLYEAGAPNSSTTAT
jgi:pilus assembly protein CpaF